MSNPLLDDLINASVIPRIELALPTRAYFYKEGEVISEEADPDCITIHPISILEESTFNDPLLLMTGHAIARMVARVAPVVKDPGKMCELDIQAILIASRIASHGPYMDVEHVCDDSECSETNELRIDLNEHILKFGSYTEDQFSQFKFPLESLGQTVMLKPMLYEDSVDITLNMIKVDRGVNKLSTNDDEVLEEDYINNYREQFERTLRTNLHAISSSIFYVETKSGGKVFDNSHITEWLKEVPLAEINIITENIKRINNDIRERSKIDYKCRKCDSMNQFFVELDPQKLFTRAEDVKMPTSSSAKSKTTGKNTKKVSRVSQRLS